MEIADRINKSKKPGETQNDTVKRLLSEQTDRQYEIEKRLMQLGDERDSWEQEAKSWKLVYEELQMTSAKRIQMLEKEKEVKPQLIA